MKRICASVPAPSTLAAWNRCSGMPRIAAVKMIMPIDAPMKPFEMMISAIGAPDIKSSGLPRPSTCIRTWFNSPTSDGLMAHAHSRM
jgi:hypothetical protein